MHISLVTKDVEIDLSVSQPFELSLLSIFSLDLYPIFNWIICFLLSSFLSSLYTLDINSLS